MLKGRKVSKRFGGVQALKALDFDVEKKKIVGLIGPNGSGKTTLFNVITGFYAPEEGEIYFKGKDITKMKPYSISKLGIGRTFQIVRPFEDLSVLENVTIGVLYGNKNINNTKEAEREAERILEYTGINELKDKPAGSLKLVERKRLEVARALATEPKLLLLDEVFAGLTPTEMEKSIDLIYSLRDEMGVTLFMIEHVMKAIMGTCDKIIVIHHGEKIAEGVPEEVANNKDVIEAYLGDYHA